MGVRPWEYRQTFLCVPHDPLNTKLCTWSIVSMLPLLAADLPETLTCRLLDTDPVYAGHQPHTATLWAALSSHPYMDASLIVCRALFHPGDKRAMGEECMWA